MSVDEFERARKADKDKRYQRALTIATGRRGDEDAKFKKKKTISRWGAAYEHQPTIPQGQSPVAVSSGSPSTAVTSLLSPPVQPIRQISPQKKSTRFISQTLCKDLAHMLSAVSHEASKHHSIRHVSPRASPRKSRKAFALKTGLQESLALNLLAMDRLSISSVPLVDINLPEKSSDLLTAYSIEGKPLGFFSPVKKRNALRLPTDTIFRDVRDMMIRSSLPCPTISSNSLLLSCEITSDDSSSEDMDSLYDIDSCSEHSFEDDYNYEDFTATSYDESYSEDASFVSTVVQHPLGL